MSGSATATPTARLVYSRSGDATSCPDEAALRRAVASRIGYDAFFPWAQRTVVAVIVRRNAAFVATVDLVDESGIDHGAHELHTEGACADLLDAIALAIAIAIDPKTPLVAPVATVATIERAPPPETPPEIPPQVSPPTPVPQPASEPPHVAPMIGPRPRAFTVEASLGGGVSLAMAPGPPAFGGTLGVALHASRFSVGVEGLFDAPSSAAARDNAPDRVSTWAAIGALVPCVFLGLVPEAPARRAGFWQTLLNGGYACAVAQAGALVSSGQKTSNPLARSTLWLAVGGRIGVALPVTGPLFFRVRADLLGELSPTTLTLNSIDQWKTLGVAGTVGIDAALRF
jgi:hypothetical protein